MALPDRLCLSFLPRRYAFMQLGERGWGGGGGEKRKKVDNSLNTESSAHRVTYTEIMLSLF